MGINLMADLGFDESTEEVQQARSAAKMYAGVIDALVACRNRIGLTQKQIAKRMGTTQSAVSDFESVNSDARFSTLIRYAQAVECDMVIELEPRVAAAEELFSAWVEVKMVTAANVIPFAPRRYRHIPERLDGLADEEMSFEVEAVAR